MKLRCRRYDILVAMTALIILSLVSPEASAKNRGTQSGTKASQATTFEGEIMDDTCARMGSHDMMMKAKNLATPELCTMYCLRYLKTPGKYVLFNAATKTTYQLDDHGQSQAAFFAAKKVTITGTYDQGTKTIRVSDIAPAS